MSDICTCGQGYDPECPCEHQHDPRISEAAKKKYQFDCHGRSSPAYGCSQPGDNSGMFYRVDDVDAETADLRRQLAEAKARGDRLTDAMEMCIKGGWCDSDFEYDDDACNGCTRRHLCKALAETEGGE